MSVMNEQLLMQSFEGVLAHDVFMKGDIKVSLMRDSKQKNKLY